MSMEGKYTLSYSHYNYFIKFMGTLSEIKSNKLIKFSYEIKPVKTILSHNKRILIN